MRKLKVFGIALLMAGAAILGDSCHVNDRFVNPIRYRNVKADPTTYQKPFKLQKKYVQNEKGMLEVYIGDGERWHKISNELRVNERSIDQMLKEHGNELARKIKERYKQNEPVIKEYMNKAVELYREIFKVEDGNGQ